MKRIRRFAAVAVVLLACAVVVYAGTTLTRSNSISTAAVSTTSKAFGGNVANGDLILVGINFGNNPIGTTSVVLITPSLLAAVLA